MKKPEQEVGTLGSLKVELHPALTTMPSKADLLALINSLAVSVTSN